MRNILLAIAIVASTATPVTAAEKADVMQVVQRWTDAFSRGALGTDSTPCAEDAVVIDDFQPHVWQGPGACSKWFKAFEAWAAKAAVSNAVIRFGQIRHLDLDGNYAYPVAPVTLSYTKAGKPVNFPGTLTMTLRLGDTGWRVSGVAWADQ